MNYWERNVLYAVKYHTQLINAIKFNIFRNYQESWKNKKLKISLLEYKSIENKQNQVLLKIKKFVVQILLFRNLNRVNKMILIILLKIKNLINLMQFSVILFILSINIL
jgi:hypothetical protein